MTEIERGGAIMAQVPTEPQEPLSYEGVMETVVKQSKGYSTLEVSDLHHFVTEVLAAGWTREKLEEQLETFYDKVHDRSYHDIGESQIDHSGLDPIIVNLVNAYEQARTNC
jgi:hypothetical protein